MDEVFEAFRNCISDWKCTNRDCPYESKCRIANGNDQYLQIPKHLALDVLNELKDQPEIVRCSACRWWHESEFFKGLGRCGQANGIALKPFDWFCADGERKEE